jgi:histidinol-phosphate phosphatase family protein
MNLKDLSFTKDWTLFLDRDGVISLRIKDGYLTRWEDFRFLEGALEAIARLSNTFGYIFIVSNQQGVGKGMMSKESLEIIDLKMKLEIRKAGGQIDASYYSPYLASENHPDRKPGTGMALKAKAAFPDIDFTRSVMVGDSPSDMEFGKKLGMVTVMISDEDLINNELADLHFRSLLEFCQQSKAENNNIMTTL